MVLGFSIRTIMAAVYSTFTNLSIFPKDRKKGAIPIAFNFRESEIGAVHVTIYEKNIKTWAVQDSNL